MNTKPVSALGAIVFSHASGCSCSAPDYAVRREAAIAAIVESDPEWRSREIVERDIPEGSCLGWVQSGHGWPVDRVHVAGGFLKLHAAALAEVEGDIHPRPMVDALVDAIARMPHGAQPCGCFITSTSTTSGDSGMDTLHAPGRQGPLAEVSWRRRNGEYHHSLSDIRPRAAARVLRGAERKENRAAAAAYEALRQDAGRRLAAGEALSYFSGQNGGVVEVVTPGTVPAAVYAQGWPADGPAPVRAPSVSARGALVAAGLTREAADAIIADAWKRECLREKASYSVYESWRADWTLTTAGVDEAPSLVVKASKLLAAGKVLTFCHHGAGYVRLAPRDPRESGAWAPATEALIAAGMSRGAAEEHVVELLAAEATTLALPGAGEAIDIDDAHAARRERAAARAHRNAHKAA